MLWIFASLPLLLLTLASWSVSGLVVARGILRINSGLTAFVLALPLGMVLQLILVNAFAHLVFFPISSWIVVVGALPLSLFCLGRPLPPLIWEISGKMRLALLALILAIMLGAFYTNAREIWDDDPSHSSMVQLMASGEFPMQFQCNPAYRASYGYGSDLLAAMTEVIAGTTPWNAMDVVKAASVASVAMLAFLVGWRYKGKVGAGLLSAFLIFTVGTMLWIFLPFSTAGGRYIAEQTPALNPLPGQLDDMVSDPWQFSTVPPGFITTSYTHSERSLSWGFAPFTILLFLVILETPIPVLIKSVTVGLVVGNTVLLHTAALAIVLPGFVGYVVLQWIAGRYSKGRLNFPPLDFNPFWALAIAFLIIAIQGGPVTDTILDKLDGLSNATTTFVLSNINLPSCRGSTLTLDCELLSVGNLGLAPFMIPWLLWVAWRGKKRSAWVIVLLGSIAAIGVTIVTFYGYFDWNIQRLISFSSWTTAVLLGPVLYDYFTRPGMVGKVMVSAAIIMISYTGLVEAVTIIDGRNVRSSTTIDFSPMVPSVELSMMKYGPALPLNARFFDPSRCSSNTAERPAYLFGRYAISALSRNDYLTPADTYMQLLKKPSADLLYKGGYTHLFIDSTWYNLLKPEAAHTLRTDPLEVIGWAGDASNFRILMRLCTLNEGCVPYVPGIMTEEIPIDFTFGDSIRVTGFRQRFVKQDNTLHVDFTATALKTMSSNYHFSLRLTRDSDGKIFANDYIAEKPTMEWAVGGTYSGHDIIFNDVPPGKYRLSLLWYDFDAPDLRSLPVVDAASHSNGDEAVLASSIEIPGTKNQD